MFCGPGGVRTRDVKFNPARSPSTNSNAGLNSSTSTIKPGILVELVRVQRAASCEQSSVMASRASRFRTGRDGRTSVDFRQAYGQPLSLRRGRWACIRRRVGRKVKQPRSVAYDEHTDTKTNKDVRTAFSLRHTINIRSQKHINLNAQTSLKCTRSTNAHRYKWASILNRSDAHN